jgi:hypothetical protein
LTRNFQGWPLPQHAHTLSCQHQLNLRLCLRPQPSKALSYLLFHSWLCHNVSPLLTPHRHWLSPHLQGWPLSPTFHNESPSRRVDHARQHLLWHCLQMPAHTTNASPTTYLLPSPHVSYLRRWNLQDSAKHSLCLPKNLIVLQTSIHRLVKWIDLTLLSSPSWILLHVNSLNIANFVATPAARPFIRN